MTEGAAAYIQGEMKKSEHSLKAAQKLLAESFTEDAISRAYYAIVPVAP